MARSARRGNLSVVQESEDVAAPGRSTPLELTADFVLVYKETADAEKTRKRVTFQRNLLETGLILSTETAYEYHFVKVNIPNHVLYQYGELLKLRMPIKLDHAISLTMSGIMVNRFLSFLNARGSVRRYTLMTEFKRDQIDLYDLDDPEFFNMCARIFVVSYILDRTSYNHKSGIPGLLIDGVYETAYPLHEGNLNNKNSYRYLLMKNWASLRNCFKPQPLNDIRNYFGPNFALYFTWQGFYTVMLIPAALVGLFCFVVPYQFVHHDGLIADICTSNYTMCPKCDVHCHYWKLNLLCERVKAAYAKDNWAAIPLSVFFTVWGVLYLSLWKRYRANVTYNWGLANYRVCAEPSRPEYLQKLAKTKTVKLNVVTLQPEPYLPFWKRKFPIYLLSVLTMFIMVAAYICIYVATNVYHMRLDIPNIHGGTEATYSFVKTTYFFTGCLLFILIYVSFNKAAKILTNLEKHRTQTEYEDSLYLKYYCFEFVLFYTGITYSAYFKSYHTGFPGHYQRIFGYRPIECLLDGCQFEIMAYTAVFLILKQIMFMFSITLVPLIRVYKMKLRNVIAWLRTTRAQMESNISHQMLDDHKLLESKYLDVYNGYLHTTIEFGFITMFGIAFPLTPLLVLIGNTLNIRLGAYMYLKYYKRPVPRRVENIGIWIKISDFICRLAVITNSCMIAISPKFIPNIVFHYLNLSEANGTGLLKNTISSYATRDLKEGTQPEDGERADVCYYFDYRYPHTHKHRYHRTMYFWMVLAARLGFVVAYHIVVYTIINFIYIAIPDVPSQISDKIQMENYHINKAILRSGKKSIN